MRLTPQELAQMRADAQQLAGWYAARPLVADVAAHVLLLAAELERAYAQLPEPDAQPAAVEEAS